MINESGPDKIWLRTGNIFFVFLKNVYNSDISDASRRKKLVVSSIDAEF